MRTAMLLYPGFTALDAIGPYHALAGIPGYEFAFVAEKAGPVSNGGSFTMEAQMSIDELAHVDVLVVPGGVAAIGMARRGHVLVDWIREMHPNTQWTTSVCTGALLLGAAGALRDLPATTHWYSHAELADYGAIPTDARVVEHGKVITSAGVSAGIDMSLVLVERIMGTEYAQAAQLDMEYDPAPPFDAGHPRSAPPAVTAWLKGMYDDMLGG
ncbi:MAG: DJ-1/PfpI family protein [Actinobacteria bacterium]|jgi:transcriptional regulator GlxA family with amidase domain|nr:DJ-1/PfpI family protein [Acidimicrobiaceae bacterium]MBP6486578.1 DJ-1/PfpI family protein [Ilumatobacteraceae bacterium]NMD25625.1 DJ-1/PfpI family protein [Actinomycetota bacterium]MBP7888315.1 DJ-1/PfpI family protein [Ilumatobacteraceae bacterium]MBP8210699.1 DJ-1/PfpI family protein [Ilumatobacteraceae bacterium]